MTELAVSEDGYMPGPEIAQDEIQPVLTQVKTSTPKNLVERAVFVSIKLGRPGINKKIKSETISFDSEEPGLEIEVGQAVENGEISQEQALDEIAKRPQVDRTMINVSKRLIDCIEYKRISSLDGKIKKYLKSRCTANLIRNEIFLLPIGLVNEVDATATKMRKERDGLIDVYGEVYEKRVDESLERLGPEGNRGDYLTWHEAKKFFVFDLQYLSLAAPTVLGNIDQKILEREQDKVAAQFQNAIEMSCQGLRQGMAEIVNALAEQLSPKPDGSKKTLKKVSVEKVMDFLQVFDARNIADDAELAILVGKAKGLLEGVDVDTLRKNDTIRDQVGDGFAKIKESLSSMVVDVPSRAITFDD